MQKIKAEAWVLLIVLSLIWGSSFILMKRGLDAYTPAEMASLRLCIAGLCLLPVAIRHYRTLNRRKLFYIFLFGLTNGAIPAFLFAQSETVVSSSTAGILNSLTPIFTFASGVLFFKTRFRWLGLIGVIIGFSGGCLLILYGNPANSITNQSSPVIYAAMIMLATVLYGFAGNIVKNHLQDVPGYAVSSFSYLIFAVPLIFWLLCFSDFPSRLMHHPQGIHSLIYIGILAVMGSAVAIILMVRLIQASNALFGSFVTYLIPVVSIIWGVADGEMLNVFTFVSLLVIIAGIVTANLNIRTKTKYNT